MTKLQWDMRGLSPLTGLSARNVLASTALVVMCIFTACSAESENGWVDFSDVLWQFDAQNGVTTAPARLGGVLFFGDEAGTLYAVEERTGLLRWTFDSGSQIRGTPLIVRSVDGLALDLVCFGTSDGIAFALTAARGAELWRFRTGGAITSSGALFRGLVYFGSHDGYLYALDAETGSRKWRFKTRGSIASSPVRAGAMIYFGSFDSRLYAVDAVTGNLEWTFKADDYLVASPGLDEERIYVGSFSGRLYALDRTSGNLAWQIDSGNPIVHAPTVTADSLYVVGTDNSLHAVEKNGGGRMRTTLLPRSYPKTQLL